MLRAGKANEEAGGDVGGVAGADEDAADGDHGCSGEED